jgi:hypothetical protein
VDQIAAWILDEVPQAAGWTFYAEEPITLPGSPCCAVWWERGAPLVEENTIGGWLGTLDSYGIRYTQPAPEAPRLLRDEDSDADLEESLTAVVAVIFNHAPDLPAPNHDMRWAGHSKLPTSNDFMFTGWEVQVEVKRPVDFA